MSKLNYLNLGCGNKFHKDWINIDMISNSPHVESYNLLNGIPFADNKCCVVYHSHLLEHIPKEKAHSFIRECFRVLKPGGLIRVVIPDLENVAHEYIKNLNDCIDGVNSKLEANYDWILLEMYDQTVRNYRGGQMGELLSQPDLINEEYVINRIGYHVRKIGKEHLRKESAKLDVSEIVQKLKTKQGIRKVVRYIVKNIQNILTSKAKKIGRFRLSGEIHMWMYDRFSLSRLLKECGFENMQIKTPFESDIPHWDSYELDVKDDMVLYPNSLFMEARKPVTSCEFCPNG